MKGIDFTPDMHRAIREGRKHMTRRTVKPQPISVEWFEHQQGWCAKVRDEGDGLCARYEMLKPKYKVGDRVFVRETWATVELVYNWEVTYALDEVVDLEGERPRSAHPGLYGAGIGPRNSKILYKSDYDECDTAEERGFKWRSPRFMPEWASRTILEITGVRVERVNEISANDAISEGIEHPFTQKDFDVVTPSLYAHFPNGPESTGWRNYLWHGLYGNYGMGNKKSDQWEYQFSSYNDPVGSFSSLWESIRGPGSWLRNDWVFVYEFKVVSE